MYRYYLSFDDTDNPETPGTGHLLQEFLDRLPYDCTFISRHQLFVHHDVPYTSHNSAMCALVSEDADFNRLVSDASEYLKAHSAAGSDPGLCAADCQKLSHPERVVAWGYRAKKELLQKNEAYALAEECRIHLSEHGGDGQGVVGALAAVGLRISGNDGRVKGKKQIHKDRLTVGELLEITGFDRVCAYGIGQLQEHAVVRTDDHFVKAVYQNYCSTILTVFDEDSYRLLTKDQLKCY